MTLLQCQEFAEDNGFDSVRFEFINLKGELIKAKWLDAYFGLFVVDGSDGFISAKQFSKAGGDLFDYKIIP